MKLQQWAPYLIVATLAAAYIYPFVTGAVDAPDFGVFLNGADLMNQGAVPSRDFVEPQGPGSFVWLALFFRLFGTTLETARVVLIATGGGISLLSFHISRRLGATGLGAAVFGLVMAVPLMPINSPHYDSNLFALGAVVVFVVAWKRMTDGNAAPAGWLAPAAALCGIATWMIQHKGLLLAAALIASILALKAIRPALVFAGTYVLVAPLPLAVFAALHALPDVVFANYIWPMTTYSAVNSAPYGFPLWRMAATGNAISVVPFFFVAILPILLLFMVGGKRWMPYGLAAYALWFSELHRLDMGHLRNGAVLMVAVLFGL